MLSIILLIGGLAGLWFGTELVVTGATHIARHHRVPVFVIGATVLAIGSDLPEIVVAAAGAIQTMGGDDRSDIIIGSSLGSTIAQGGLVLGVAGLVSALTIQRSVAIFHGAWLAAAAIVLLLHGLSGELTRAAGISLVVLYAVYLTWVVTRARAHDHAQPPEIDPRSEAGLTGAHVLTSWLRTIVGIGVVLIAADVTVTSAHDIAELLSVPDVIIAVTILAIGSSLPELTVSIMSAIRREGALSAGTLLGSNVLDTLLPIGIAATITTISMDRTFLAIEIPTIVLLAVMATVFLGGRGKMRSWQAALLIVAYVAYLVIRLA